jgi:hypothetical protein
LQKLKHGRVFRGTPIGVTIEAQRPGVHPAGPLLDRYYRLEHPQRR